MRVALQRIQEATEAGQKVVVYARGSADAKAWRKALPDGVRVLNAAFLGKGMHADLLVAPYSLSQAELAMLAPLVQFSPLIDPIIYFDQQNT